MEKGKRQMMGWVLVLGLLLINASLPLTPQSSTSAIPKQATNRNSFLSALGEENTDPFVVNPSNRWVSDLSGTYTDTISNGELLFQSYSNSSASMNRFRTSSTTDDKIKVRWRLDADETNASELSGEDFQYLLVGINVTTSNSNGNCTLNAYPWNSSHYSIRPTFTRGNGVNWTSWNIGNEYQDLFQMTGTVGADGVDFMEGNFEGITFWASAYQDEEVENGSLRVSANSAVSYLQFYLDTMPTIDAGDYPFLEIRIATSDNSSGLRVDDGSDYITALTKIPTSGWHIMRFDLSADADWTGTENALGFTLDKYPSGSFVGGESFWFDYIRLTTTNSSTITDDDFLCEYNSNYRAEIEFDLRSSKLSFEIQDDEQEEIIETNIANFEINDYFEPLAVIPDIFQAETGAIEYLFGAKTIMINSSIYWDYYQAEFIEHSFDLQSETTVGTGIWNSHSAMGAHAESSASGSARAVYALTVPEFDSASGSLKATGTNQYVVGNNDLPHNMTLTFYSVDTATGVLTEEMEIVLEMDEDKYWQTQILYDGTATNPANCSPSTNRLHAEVGFSVHFDKKQRTLSCQLAYNEPDGDKKRQFATADVVDQSNEFVIKLVYRYVCTNPGGDNVHFLVESWSLTYRDIFGIPLPLPDIDVSGGGLLDFAFDILLLPLRLIEIGISGLALLLDGILSLLGELPHMLAELGSIFNELIDVNNWLSAIDSLLDTVISTLDSVIDELEALANSIYSEFEGLLNTIGGFIQAVAQDIIDLFLTETWEIVDSFLGELVAWVRTWAIAGVTLGDILDLFDEIMDLGFAALATTIQFITMLVVIWGAIVIAGIWGYIFISSAARSVAQQDPWLFPELVFSKLAWNVPLPQIFGTGLPTPIGAFIVPYVIWILLFI